MTFLFRLDMFAAGGVKDLATAYICIHAHKLNRANTPPPVSFFLRLQRHPNGPRPVCMLSSIFRDDLFSFELSGFLREVDRKRRRGLGGVSARWVS